MVETRSSMFKFVFILHHFHNEVVTWNVIIHRNKTIKQTTTKIKWWNKWKKIYLLSRTKLFNFKLFSKKNPKIIKSYWKYSLCIYNLFSYNALFRIKKNTSRKRIQFVQIKYLSIRFSSHHELLVRYEISISQMAMYFFLFT